MGWEGEREKLTEEDSQGRGGGRGGQWVLTIRCLLGEQR